MTAMGAVGRLRDMSTHQPQPNPPAAATPMVRAEGVRKSFPVGSGAVDVLRGISLSVSAGEICAVMGPSGCGKSTLMYCLAGLEEPSQGRVTLAGQDLGSKSRADLAKLRRQQIGFVFQSYNLVPTLSAFENVALPARLRGARPNEDAIMAALTSVGIEALAKSFPSSMSGGEQQRVALARVLAQQPDVVFADEPTGALDLRSGEIVMAELTEIGRQAGRCVLLVTHDPNVAAACDRVMFMLDGEVSVQALAPSSEEVASVLADLSEQARARRTNPAAGSNGEEA